MSIDIDKLHDIATEAQHDAGLTRPESYELWFGASAWKRVGSGQTQRACKAEAEGM